MKQIFLYILCLFTCVSYAQTDRCVAQLDSSEIMLGQSTKLTVSLFTPKDAYLVFPDVHKGFLKDFDILGNPLYDTVFQDSEFSELVCTYYITRFEPGSISFQAGPYIINEHDTIWSNPISLTIQMPVVDTTAAIRALKPIKNVVYTWRDWAPKVILVALIVLVIVLLVFFIVRYLKQRPKSVSPRIAPVQLSAKERALQAFDELEQKQLCAQRKHKQHYTELLDILRAYFEEVLGVQVFEKTSLEMLDELSSTGRFRVQQLDDLRALLHDADLVKFAKYIPEKQIIGMHGSIARSLIQIKDLVVSES